MDVILASVAAGPLIAGYPVGLLVVLARHERELP